MRQGGLRSYILRRLIISLVIAWGILTITFILLRVSPSSPADRYLSNMGARSSDPNQVVAAINARYGLDKPIHEQYFDYLGNLLRGDWGWSFSKSMPVGELIKTHWLYSFQLILLTVLVSSVLGILIGVYSAVKQYTKFDYAATMFSLAGISIPAFWLGIMLMLVFSVRLGWFKTYYDTGLPMFSFANLKALALPVLTLSIGSTAGYIKYARSATLDNLRKDFVKFARAKGLPERVVIGKHVFRNALLTLVTIFLSDLSGVVFGGAYLIEIIYSIPGLGRISYNAILNSDYAIVITITLIGALVTLLTNLATDIAYTWIDPRIRYN